MNWKFIGKHLRLISAGRGDGGFGLRRIVQLGLPIYSNVSFTSKLLMFLDPQRFVVLDGQLARLGEARLLGPLRLTTGIAPTRKNLSVYSAWCHACSNGARQLGLGYRAVDIERGIFALVQRDALHEAGQIVDAL